MLTKFAFFLKMYIFHRFSYVIITITSASFASLASLMLKTELMISDKHIYFCVFQ